MKLFIFLLLLFVFGLSQLSRDFSCFVLKRVLFAPFLVFQLLLYLDPLHRISAGSSAGLALRDVCLMGHLNQGSEELVSLILGKAKLPSFHSVTFSHSIMGALCYCQWNGFSIFPPAPHPCLCSSSIAVHASLGSWLIGKLVPAEEVEDSVQVCFI